MTYAVRFGKQAVIVPRRSCLTDYVCVLFVKLINPFNSLYVLVFEQRLSHHFDGFLKPVFVVLSGEPIGKDSRALVFPQQQHAALIRDDVSRPV